MVGGGRVVLGVGAEFWDLFVVVGAVDAVDRTTSAQVGEARGGVDETWTSTSSLGAGCA
jgi:hypothetical protein